MDRRHFLNSFTGKMDHGRQRNHPMANQSYLSTGAAAVPENGPLLHPINSSVRGGYRRATHWNSEYNDYSSSSNMQAPPHHPRSFPGPYSDPSGSGSIIPIRQGNSAISHPSDSDSYLVNRNTYEPQASVTRSRVASKRKGPENSVPYEMGSSSGRSYRRLNSNVYSSHGEGPYSGNDYHGDDSTRNVRRRSTLVLEDNVTRNHVSTYSTCYQYPPNNSSNYYGAERNGDMGGGGTNQSWNLGANPHIAHERVQIAGTSGLSYRNNQLIARGNSPERRDHSDSFSSRHVASSFQNVHAQGGRSSHSVRDIHLPSYDSGQRTQSYYPMRHEPVSTGERQYTNSLSSYRHSSQSSRGWGNSYTNRTSRLAVQRFQLTDSIVNSYGRAEGMMMDLPTFYANSHDFFDQYRDMRLDIDDMSYEELLELGESIGTVKTGLSVDVLSSSLTEEAYYLKGNSPEETCVICLEEFGNEVKIGTLKNCGHGYHADCIKKWLSMKNLCPICKSPAQKDCVNQE